MIKQEIIINEKFKHLIPPLKNEEYEQLTNNILADGCRDPLVLFGSVLIDGHNRFAICTEHNIEFNVVQKHFESEDEAKLWIIYNQFGRRNITDFVRAELALQAKPIISARAKENQLSTLKQNATVSPNLAERSIDTREELAKTSGVSHSNISKVESILSKGSPELIQAVRTNEISINLASDIATLEHGKQSEIVASGKNTALLASKEIRNQKAIEQRTKRIEKINEISKSNLDIESVNQQFSVILCDPPWRYEYIETESRAIENQYPTMSHDELCAIDIDSICNPDCVMYMWATSPKLQESMDLLKAWGFNYRTCAVWDKEVIGMGYYFRQQHELLLVAVRGNLPTPLPSNRVSSVIRSKRAKHSEKPIESYEIIELMYPEFEKLEMFCRSPRIGWKAWGNQSNVA